MLKTGAANGKALLAALGDGSAHVANDRHRNVEVQYSF